MAYLHGPAKDSVEMQMAASLRMLRPGRADGVDRWPGESSGTILPVTMKVIADLSLVPIGVGVSLSKYVAAAHKELEAAGLSCHLHAYGTNVEGEYDQVFAALKRCLERIHEMGAPRVTCTIKLGSRVDRDQGISDKIASVEDKLGNR
jgi:uncharacterized protein (TIGR00106 family)